MKINVQNPNRKHFRNNQSIGILTALKKENSSANKFAVPSGFPRRNTHADSKSLAEF